MYVYPQDLLDFMRMWARFQAIGGEECMTYQDMLDEERANLELEDLPE